MAQALSGDAASKRQVEDVFRYALDAENPDQGRAIVSVLLLKEALSEAEEYRAQQAAAQPAPAPAPPSAEETQATPAPPSNFCIHNRPVDVPCPLCEASIGRVEAA